MDGKTTVTAKRKTLHDATKPQLIALLSKQVSKNKENATEIKSLKLQKEEQSKELERYNQENEELKEACRSLQSQVHTLEKETERLATENDALTTQNSTWDKEVEKMVTQVSDLETALSKAQQQLKMYEQSRPAVNGTDSDEVLTNKINLLQGQLGSGASKEAKIQAENESLQSKINQLEETLLEKQQQDQDRQPTISSSELVDLQAKVDELEQELTAVSQENALKDLKVQELSCELKTRDEELENIRAEKLEMDLLNADVDRLKQDRDSAKDTQILELKKKTQKYSDGIAKYKEVSQKLHSNLKSLSERVKELNSNLSLSHAREYQYINTLRDLHSSINQCCPAEPPVILPEYILSLSLANAKEETLLSAVGEVSGVLRKELKRILQVVQTSSSESAQLNQDNQMLNVQVIQLQKQLEFSEETAASVNTTKGELKQVLDAKEKLQSANIILEKKLRKMKDLLVRANTHIEQSTRQLVGHKANNRDHEGTIAEYKRNFARHWFPKKEDADSSWLLPRLPRGSAILTGCNSQRKKARHESNDVLLANEEEEEDIKAQSVLDMQRRLGLLDNENNQSEVSSHTDRQKNAVDIAKYLKKAHDLEDCDEIGVSVSECNVVKRINLDGIIWCLIALENRDLTRSASEQLEEPKRTGIKEKVVGQLDGMVEEMHPENIGNEDNSHENTCITQGTASTIADGASGAMNASSGTEIKKATDIDEKQSAALPCEGTLRENEKSDALLHAHNFFWTLQDVFLYKLIRHNQKQLLENPSLLQQVQDQVQNTSNNSQDLIACLDYDAARSRASSLSSVSFSFVDMVTLPATMDTQIVALLDSHFDKKWTSNARHFQEVEDSLRAQLEATDLELVSLQDDFDHYKANAKAMLQDKEEELTQLHSQLDSFASLSAQYESLTAKHTALSSRAAEVDAAAVRITELQEEIDNVRFDYARLSTQSKQQESKFRAQIRKLEQEMSRLRSEHAKEITEKQQEILDAKQDSNQSVKVHRSKAAELLASKDKQIAKLQQRLHQSLAISGGSHRILNQTSPSQASTSSDPIAAIIRSLESGNISLDEDDKFEKPVSLSRPPSSTQSAGAQLMQELLVQSNYRDALEAKANDGNGKQSSIGNEISQLASLQAHRDSELTKQRDHIRQLQQLLRDQELAASKLREDKAQLVSEVGEYRRKFDREQELKTGDNIEYLKNVIVGYLCSDQTDQNFKTLFPVLCTVLKLSSEEIQKIHKSREAERNIFSFF